MNDVMVGAISGVIASLIGAVLTAFMSYLFQARLLNRQMEMQRQLLEEEKKFQTQLLERQFQETRHRDFINKSHP